MFTYFTRLRCAFGASMNEIPRNYEPTSIYYVLFYDNDTTSATCSNAADLSLCYAVTAVLSLSWLINTTACRVELYIIYNIKYIYIYLFTQDQALHAQQVCPWFESANRSWLCNAPCAIHFFWYFILLNVTRQYFIKKKKKPRTITIILIV